MCFGSKDGKTDYGDEHEGGFYRRGNQMARVILRWFSSLTRKLRLGPAGGGE